MPRRSVSTEAERQEGEGLFAPHGALSVRYARNELICQRGSYAAGVYMIESGLVSESMPLPDDTDTVPYAILGPTDLIGLEVLLPGDSELHLTSCRAVVDTRLSFLERNALLSALKSDEQLRRFVLESVTGRLYALAGSLRQRNAAPNERLCSLLLDLAVKHGEPSESESVSLPRSIDRRLLAELSGLSASQFRRAWDTLPALGEASGQKGIRLSAQELRAWQQGGHPL